MENSHKHALKARARRALRVRKGVRGDQERPRLCVVKSNQHVHVQLIDDERSLTLASASTLSKEFRQTEYNRRNRSSAKQLGIKIAELAKRGSIDKVVFDRGAFKYHGVIAAVAEGAREGGLQF